MKESFVHETAVIDEGAQLGRGSAVWHFAHVMAGASVGEDVSLGQGVFVGTGVVVGDGCRIQNNVSLFEGVVLEDAVFCGPSAVFTNVRYPRAAFPTASNSYEQTRVKAGATIGANVTVVCGVTIGECAFIGAGAVVTADIPAFALMVGVPARRVGWSCRCGRPLEVAAGRAGCGTCGRKYRELEGPSLVAVE